MKTNTIVDELCYVSYRENRRLSPHVAPERWKKIYPNVEEMEARLATENKSQYLDKILYID